MPGENLRAVMLQLAHRPHAGQDHGGIHKGINEPHALEAHVARHADGQRHNDGAQSHKAMAQQALRKNFRGLPVCGGVFQISAGASPENLLALLVDNLPPFHQCDIRRLFKRSEAVGADKVVLLAHPVNLFRNDARKLKLPALLVGPRLDGETLVLSRLHRFRRRGSS